MIFHDITEERIRQDIKWGVQDHDDKRWLTILMEEVGEAAKAILDRNGKNLDEELIQVAAVAVAWMECRMRKESRDGMGRTCEPELAEKP